MYSYVIAFLGAALLSVGVEGVVAAVLARALNLNRTIIWVATVGTLFTLPYVWFVIPTLLWEHAGIVVITGELFAAGTEAVLYRYIASVPWKTAVFVSVLANAASYFLGKLV